MALSTVFQGVGTVGNTTFTHALGTTPDMVIAQPITTLFTGGSYGSPTVITWNSQIVVINAGQGGTTMLIWCIKQHTILGTT